MDKQIRSRLQKLVSNCRSLLDKEFTAQLQMIYGMQPTGRIDELSTLTHLDNEQYRIATLLRDRVNHLSGLSSSGKEALREAVQRLIREQAFTVLNRFAALKMCEERQITQECVKNGYQSKGFQLFLATCGSGIGDTYRRYVVFIKSIFDELSLDLGVLFDRFSPFGLLFPRENAMEKLFAELNTPELSDIWKEDETIGWVYQYFNSKEERKAMRKSSSAPRNSRELAVRNQFFTPRYVVQFLTDNTLGRIWYEMTRSDTALKERCEYLVRRSQEVFLAEGENPPDMPEEDRDKSQEELLKEPEYIPYRKIKDPREIRMLDPACGSMHFGLYAFDLYETIYEEVWDRCPELLQDIRERIKEKQEFLSIVPELIIRHNIHGIDIDHRAVQIAGLSLWLRAQKSYHRLGIQPEDRPRITRSNVVCAEPMPGEKDYLEEFISRLKPAVLGDLVKDVWEKMQLAGEAGSLLKIEEELSGSIRKAREVWEKYKFEKGAYIEQDLFEKRKQLSLKEMIRFDISDIESMEEWDQMEAMVLSALKEFAESASGNGGYNRKLFAEDAAQGFAFIDVCRKRYDVVLMNPPFGSYTKNMKLFIENNYTRSKYDLYACFIDRALLFGKRHLLGCITARTGFYIASLSQWRKEIFSNNALHFFVDLGGDVLDAAMVETAFYVLKANSLGNCSLFLKVDDEKNKNSRILDLLENYNNNKFSNLFITEIRNLMNIPGSSLAYWLHPSLRMLYLKYCRFEGIGGNVYNGVQTDDDFRFIRAWWEVNNRTILNPCIGITDSYESCDFVNSIFNLTKKNTEWITIIKGGSSYRFRAYFYLVILWKDNAKELRAFTENAAGGRVKNENSYFRPAISWALRTNNFDPHAVPALSIPSVSRSIIINSASDLLFILGIMNSNIVDELCKARMEKWLQPKFISSVIQDLPWKLPNENCLNELNLLSKETSILTRNVDLTEENNRDYILSINRDIRLEENVNEINSAISNDNRRLIDITNKINIIAFSYYDIDESTPLQNNNKNEKLLSDLISTDDFARTVCSYILGTMFGRWDLRTFIFKDLRRKVENPFDPLPVCSPGMLVGPNGLPAESGGIVSEEWLRARPNAITLPPEGSVKNPTIPDLEYPIEVAWNGILLDDPSHKDDIIGRMRQCFQVIWQEKADSIEQEACEILDIKDLRDYFRRPSGFFADHLKRYSKSRRQAPIYWPLSTASGPYTLWIYYPRLTDQTLYRCVNDYINPKLEHIAREIELQQKEIEKSEAMKARQELEDLLNMQQEIRELKEEMLRVAELPYKPNLNDGVLITASPLHKLFRLAKWRKELGKCWESLEKGDYDWAHLAYSIWPDRVREKCRKDRSLAIAHDLEDICEVAPKAAKKKAKSNAMEEKQIDLM